MRRLALIAFALLPCRVWADQVPITAGTVYVTKADCLMLVRHRPSPDVAFTPGVDVHGRYVAPADLPGAEAYGILPDSVHFEVQINPLAYAGGARRGPAGQTFQGGKYANTAMPVARVDVDLKSGEASLNGRPLTAAQDRAILEACRKAGIR